MAQRPASPSWWSLLDLPLPALDLVARHLAWQALGRLACCSRELRSFAYQAWPTSPAALRLAARHGNLRLLRAQLEAGAASIDSAGTDGRTALYAAAAGGHPGAVEMLLAAGASVDRENERDCLTELMAAAAYGHALVVQLLLSAGADPNRATR